MQQPDLFPIEKQYFALLMLSSQNIPFVHVCMLGRGEKICTSRGVESMIYLKQEIKHLDFLRSIEKFTILSMSYPLSYSCLYRCRLQYLSNSKWLFLSVDNIINMITMSTSFEKLYS